jgi:hypothetical protein
MVVETTRMGEGVEQLSGGVGGAYPTIGLPLILHGELTLATPD